MVIDFTKLNDMIPQKGMITLVVKKNPDGTLGVIYKSTHHLLKPDSSYEKEVKGTQETIEAATKKLEQPRAFSGTPESLTEQFEVALATQTSTERSLAAVINETTESMNALIKELKNKKSTKPSAKQQTTAAKASQEKKDASNADPLEGTLFGGTAAPAIESKSLSTGNAPGDTSAQADVPGKTLAEEQLQEVE